ncbi:MAG: HAD-IIB family hydrolase [Thermodesulfobacteriota bacterium]|nr:HAD-IIB family hydrolase [Thermodesulfobacteriota bacterium]
MNIIKSRNFLIFTDLDGTLLYHDTYSFDAARCALDHLKELDIPLIFCTSKTKAEVELWRERLRNADPFITENGGGIFFCRSFQLNHVPHVEKSDYSVIELGIPHDKLMAHFNTLKERLGNKILGFSEMSISDLMNLTGLPYDEVLLSKERDYTEPFAFFGNQEDQRELLDIVKELNLNLTKGGRFYHLLGDNDKGKAVKIVIDIYKDKFLHLKTVGIGDSYNDLPMLEVVDIPVLVQKPGGTYDDQIDLPYLLHAPGIGPAGFNEALLSILSSTEEERRQTHRSMKKNENP